jgi:hypothetical protein
MSDIKLDAAAFLEDDVYKNRTAGEKVGANGRYEVLYASPEIQDGNGQSLGQTSGYYGVAYKDTETGQVWIAHRGTQFSSGEDIVSLMKAAVGKIPEQGPDAIAFSEMRQLLDVKEPIRRDTMPGLAPAGDLLLCCAAKKEARKRTPPPRPWRAALATSPPSGQSLNSLRSDIRSGEVCVSCKPALLRSCFINATGNPGRRVLRSAGQRGAGRTTSHDAMYREVA